MKRIFILLTSMFLTFGFVACSSKHGNTADYNLKNAPSWVFGEKESKIYGVGSAKIQNNNIDAALKDATIKATADITSILEQRIEQATKILEKDGVTESVRAIRQSVDKMLRGVARTKTWISDDGSAYVKVEFTEVDRDILKNNIGTLEKVNKEAALEINKVVDDIIDGSK